MDLSTRYLGFDLAHPLVPGAGPLSEDLDTVRRLVDAGAPMIVLSSLFEEQLVAEQLEELGTVERYTWQHAEALSYFPDPLDYRLGTHDYLDHIVAVKEAVDVPVVASLNGSSLGGWLDYAKQIEHAGADALELNVYDIATDLEVGGARMEANTCAMVRAVCENLTIPVAVKLSPFYTSTGNLCRRLVEAGAKAVVLFNRFYQADIDIEELETERALRPSDSSELLLRLRWAAILSGRVSCDLAVTGGVHTVSDAVKAVMCGAHSVQLVSALLRGGPGYLAAMRNGLAQWMEEHEYQSIAQMRGSMGLLTSPDPHAFERGNYVKILKGWST